ncbi:hypothetical protein MKX03_029822 [Papaver bracteatum]|nr:hypothetical protein MKX03_029822 [Papaver bracteatum]
MTRFNGGGNDDDHRKLMEDYNSEQEEEEALSLCDLPIKQEVNQQSTINNNIKSNKAAEIEEFEFGSWVGSVLTESEICVADDVFFQGRILPLRRHSVSSENGFSLKRQDSNPSNISKNPSRSSSLDRSSSGVYTTSSRSSSSKSHNSISSASTSTTTTTTSGHYKPLKNIFHSHPSPKPQIWNSSNNSKSIRRNVISGRTGKQSTTWGLFRVGLVKTPQIELQDLRLRNCKSFNGSCSSSGSSNKSTSLKNISKGTGNDNGEKKKMQRFYLGFESCKCSTDAVENTVSSKTVVIRSNSRKKTSNGSELMKEEVIVKKEEDDDHIDDEKEMIKKDKEQGKKQKELMNHLRTFEWLKQLSVADVPD